MACFKKLKNRSCNQSVSPIDSINILLKYSKRNEKKILKIFLLWFFFHLFCELFQQKINNDEHFPMEYHIMDNKIIQLLLSSIIESGDSNLEGIAYHTRIPYDVIYEAAAGISNQFTITMWAKIVDLFTQVNPEITQISLSKLIELIEKNKSIISSLLKKDDD